MYVTYVLCVYVCMYVLYASVDVCLDLGFLRPLHDKLNLLLLDTCINYHN